MSNVPKFIYNVRSLPRGGYVISNKDNDDIVAFATPQHLATWIEAEAKLLESDNLNQSDQSIVQFHPSNFHDEVSMPTIVGKNGVSSNAHAKTKKRLLW
jgi:hypothetical protein